MEPNTKNFPKRNRLISGISNAVLVVEAEYRSGSTITANFAKEEEKKVYAIPSNIDSTKGIGTNKLIRDGAIIITKPSEIIKDFNPKNNPKNITKIKKTYANPKQDTNVNQNTNLKQDVNLKQNANPKQYVNLKQNTNQNKNITPKQEVNSNQNANPKQYVNLKQDANQNKNINLKQEVNSNQNANPKQGVNLDIPNEYKSIYNLLQKNPMHINEISKKEKKQVSEINGILTIMEIEGYIERLAQNQYKLKE